MPGINAFGTTFGIGDGGDPETFEPVAQVTSISGPGIERETLDVSAHDSPDGWREFVGGLKDPGEVSIDINYDPSIHDTLLADLSVDVATNYELVFPDSSTWSFSGFLSGFEPEAPHDAKLAASLTFKVTGQPTFSG